MDSRLLNAYHDDPYDPTYERYDSNVADGWSTDTISMELTDTLDGILPIPATDTVANEAYCNILLSDDHLDDKEFNNHIKNSNALVYNDFDEQHFIAEERVGTIDTNEFLENVQNSLTDHLKPVYDDNDAKSVCSYVSFRTRTDSSSIGDYESHSSDYDDTEDEEAVDDDDYEDNTAIAELEADDLLTDLPGLNLLNGEDFMFAKKRTISTNTIGSDVDAANFDLAEFITKDDDLLAKSNFNTTPIKVKSTASTKSMPNIKIEKNEDNEKNDEAETDSDIIVDVETIEFEDDKARVLLLKKSASELPDDNLAYVDNVKADPEWDPKEVKPKIPKASPKKMYGAKNNGATALQQGNKLNNKKQILQCTQTNVQTPQHERHGHGMGKGGKNLALLKRDCESIEAKNNETKTKDKDIALFKHDSHSIDAKSTTNNCNLKKPNAEHEKRKLNLEEYKRRYADELKTQQINKSTTTAVATTAVQAQTSLKTNVKSITKTCLNPNPVKVNKPHSEAVTTIVKTLKEGQTQNNQVANQKIDPITLARNKVLRMQELKRAQQMKIIDSTISAKVPRVTKLLPLQEIIKDTAYAIKTTSKDEKSKQFEIQNHPDYEKIVMVSVACNTALTLSPKDLLPTVPLLKNVTTNLNENIKISHNSLITSIQDAVIKQSLPKASAISENTNLNKSPNVIAHAEQQQQVEQQQQHGEDKIIMHLRKDRIRERNTRSIEIQTDFQAAFPILPLPKSVRKLRQSRRKYRNHEETSIVLPPSSGVESSQSDGEDINNRTESSLTTIEYPNSDMNGASSIGGYSSRSSRRHRSSVSSSYSESGHPRKSRDSKRKSNYRKSMRKNSRRRSSSSSSSTSSLSDYTDRSRTRSRSRNRIRSRSRSPYYENRNAPKPAVEERRIVYVGRIEEETSKEMLRRKFIAYGSIRQITLHHKENGMKYGFVTFERSEDAFAVIDNSARDAQINMYDISFGGRRAFCRTSYADLDNAGINNYHSYVFPVAPAAPKQEDSFEALLQKVKAKLDANKTTSSNKL